MRNFLQILTQRFWRADGPALTVASEKLVHRIDLRIDASCPCGSQILHALTLMSAVECPRCGHTLAIRSIEYHRMPASVPDPTIIIGWVHPAEALSARSRGVH